MVREESLQPGRITDAFGICRNDADPILRHRTSTYRTFQSGHRAEGDERINLISPGLISKFLHWSLNLFLVDALAQSGAFPTSVVMAVHTADHTNSLTRPFHKDFKPSKICGITEDSHDSGRYGWESGKGDEAVT